MGIQTEHPLNQIKRGFRNTEFWEKKGYEKKKKKLHQFGLTKTHTQKNSYFYLMGK